MFDLFDVQGITLLLRWLVVLQISLSAYELWLINKTVNSHRLKKLASKALLIFITFGALRMIAALLDAWLAFQIGVFSNAVNFTMFMFPYFFLRSCRKNLERSRVHEVTGEKIVATLFDGIINEMEIARNVHPAEWQTAVKRQAAVTAAK